VWQAGDSGCSGPRPGRDRRSQWRRCPASSACSGSLSSLETGVAPCVSAVAIISRSWGAMVFGKLNGNAGVACGGRQQREARTIEGFLEPRRFRTWQVDSVMMRHSGDFKIGNGRNKGAVPRPLTLKTPTSATSRLNDAALPSAAYAARSALPHPHARLAAGWWLAFTGRESNPLDYYERFPVSLPPFQA
jgi:hypothetical protein